jgi:2',3'-cyclic-nucleotide 2'-phosphodiesterase (5'-nucleotidase family)
MWRLTTRLSVKVTDAEKYGFDPAKTYQVVGTCDRWQAGEDGKKKCYEMLLAVNDRGEITQVFPAKCKAAPAALVTSEMADLLKAFSVYGALNTCPADLAALCEHANRLSTGGKS